MVSQETEIHQNGHDVVPFVREVLIKNRARMTPLVDFVVISDEQGDVIYGHHDLRSGVEIAAELRPDSKRDY